MFLSIIVPVYNGAQYLSACLDSLLAQDISPKEYQILCVNDGSTDTSGAILAEYAAANSNILVLQQPNSGVVAARNAGLKAASGDYIWFVDADDEILPNTLGRLRMAIDGQGDLLQFGGYQFQERMTSQEWELARKGCLPDHCPGSEAVVWRSLIRHSFLDQNGLTFRHPHLTHGEDGQFMYEVFSCGPKVITLCETVYLYRIRPYSAETAASPESRRKRIRSHIAVAKIMGEYYHSGRQDTHTVNRLMSTLWYALYGIATLPLGETRQALKELRKSGLYPFRRPARCDLVQSYMFDTETISGKLFDRLYLGLHRPCGFWLVWLAMHLLAPFRH